MQGRILATAHITLAVEDMLDLAWTSSLLYVSLGLLSFLGLRAFLSRSSEQRLPPGPKRRWVTGNLLDLPPKIDFDVLTSWENQYGKL